MNAHDAVARVVQNGQLDQVLLLAHVWNGLPPAPRNLKSWQTHDAKCWFERVDTITLVERFQECCRQLDRLSADARKNPGMEEEYRIKMIPYAEEALAIRNVL